MKLIQHHNDSLYCHCLEVARIAYSLSLFFHVNTASCVKAALLHDFFHYDWREKIFPKGKYHAFEHGKIAAQNAEIHFGPLTRDEISAIRGHMWPLTFLPPFNRIGWIITLSDKIVTVRDILHWVVKRP